MLPREGFDDIFWISDHWSGAWADILARKDGETYAVDVTLNYVKHIKPHTVAMNAYLGFKSIAVFVKPDFSLYVIKDMPKNQTCVGIYDRRVIMREAEPASK